MNSSTSRLEPLQDFPPSPGPASGWGLVGIFGLIVLLGGVLAMKFQVGGEVWSRWQQHQMNELVLGQSPAPAFHAVPADEDAAPATSGSSVPPLWSRTRSNQVERSRQAAPAKAQTGMIQLLGHEEVSAAKPVQSRSVPSAPGLLPSNHGIEQISAPTSLFAGEVESARPRHAESLPPMAAPPQQLPEQQLPEQYFPEQHFPGQALPGPAPEQTAAAADPFALPGEMASGSGRVRHQVQQAGGTDPAAFGNSEILTLEPSPAPQQSPAPRTELPPVETHDLFGARPESGAVPMQEPRPASRTELPPPGLTPQGGLPPVDQPARMEPLLHNPSPSFATPAESRPAAPMSHAENPIPAARPAKAAAAQAPFEPSVRSASQAPVPKDPLPVDDVYQVQSGDNYWTISRQFYGSARFFSALAAYNQQRIPDPSKMKPGMYVLVPHIEVLHQQYPQLTGGGPRDPGENQPPGFFVDDAGRPAYRVGKGDTLTEIAQKHLGRASRWVQIYGMNKDRIPDGKTLKIGSVLQLPADASQIQLAPANADIR